MRSTQLIALATTCLLFLSMVEAKRWGFGGYGYGRGFGFNFGGGGGGGDGSPSVGDQCEPTVPRPCGEKTPLGPPEIKELDENQFGPNVCNYTYAFEVKTYIFEMRRSSRCYFKFYNCPLTCSCTGRCSGETTVIEKWVIDCCDGYTTPRPSPLESLKSAVSSYRSCKDKPKISSSGCPFRMCTDEEGPGEVTTDAPTDAPTDMPNGGGAGGTTQQPDIPTGVVIEG